MRAAPWKMQLVWNRPLWAVCAVVLSCASLVASSSVDTFLEAAKAHMAAQQYTEALDAYSRAIALDPTNYLTYYKRATVQFAMGRSKTALEDLDEVIRLRPEFSQALLQRANYYFRSGRFDLARADFQKAGTPEAQEKIHQVDTVENHIAVGRSSLAHQNFSGANHVLGLAVELCPSYDKLRILRAQASIGLGDLMSAIGDLSRATKLNPDNADAHYTMSTLYFTRGEPTEALKAVRDCLKIDADHPQCNPYYKKLKRFEKLLLDGESKLAAGDGLGAIDKLS
eukprot:Opistho-2@94474